MKKQLFLPLALVCIIFSCQKIEKYKGWPGYNGGPESIKYSALTQIDTSNVASLKLAWTYHSGGADSAAHSQIQCNPIVIDGRLYGVNPSMVLFCVDAATGKEHWKFDANAPTHFDDNPAAYHNMINSRGMAYWTDGGSDQRIFFTAGSLTYAIDAQTGKPIPSFGQTGHIDLHKGLGRDVDDLFVVSSSPGIVYHDLLIMGSRVDEELPGAPGHIRAYNVRTGEQKWIFHTIPQPGQPGHETWADPEAFKTIGAANVWNGFSLDEQRGLVFCGTGSASYDFYGGLRKGANLYANCVLALDATTGQRRWHYQTIHHDVWDKDLPAAPLLVRVKKDGKEIDAVAQITKNAFVFLLERESGKPIFEIDEVPVDTLSNLPGEKLHPTQPIPRLPKPFARQSLTLNDINPYLPASEQQRLRKLMASYRVKGMFTPPGSSPSIIFPGYDGGGEWGGAAWDPETGLMYVNASEMAWVMEIQKKNYERPKAETQLQAGQRLFAQNCSSCHGADRKGTGNNPNISDVATRYTAAAFLQLLNSGRRMMPSFQRLSNEEKTAIASFILEQKTEQNKPYTGGNAKYDLAKLMPYKMKGYNRFLASNGMPAISPPWGTLNAINLHTGQIAWKVPLGEWPELKAKGIAPTGAEGYGGPVVTKGGLVFIAATRDGYLRAFHKNNGKLLWQYKLPAPGFASPAVYELQGKQYLVIACGGGKLGTNSSDSYLAFSL
jgi:quinoprotein glucose dehydrogenase